MIKIAYRKVYDLRDGGNSSVRQLFYRDGEKLRIEESAYVTIVDEKNVYGIVHGPLNFLEMKAPRQYHKDISCFITKDNALSGLDLGHELEFMKKHNAVKKDDCYELSVNDISVSLLVNHGDIPQQLRIHAADKIITDIIYDSYAPDLPLEPGLFKPYIPLRDKLLYCLIPKTGYPDEFNVTGGSRFPTAIYVSFPFFSRFFSLITGKKHEPFRFCLYGDNSKNYDETDSVTAYFNSILERSRLHQLVAMAFLFIALVLATLCPYMLVLMLFSFMFFLWAYWNVRVNIVCPECGKNLSYLLLDPSYSGSIGILLFPRKWSTRFSECPFCKYKLLKDAEKRNVD